MRKMLISVVLGLIVGSGATYYLVAEDESSVRSLPAALTPNGGSGPSGETRLPAGGRDVRTNGRLADSSTLSQAALYGLVAQSDFDSTAALLEDAISIANPRARRLALEIVLSRLAELDPRRGVQVSAGLGLAAPDLAPLFQRWAEDELEAALSTLSTTGTAAERRAIALAILQDLGANSLNTSRVLAALPESESAQLQVEALELQARSSPYDALEYALSLRDAGARNASIQRIATIWAQQSPDAAFIESERITDQASRTLFTNALVAELARTSPAVALQYIDRFEDSLQQQLGLSMAFSGPAGIVEPVQFVGLNGALPGTTALGLKQRAVQQWAASEPLAAIAYAESLPLGIERQALLMSAAQGYARQDPDAALGWLASLGSATPRLEGAVYAAIAESDPSRALGLIVDSNTAGSLQARMETIMPMLINLSRDAGNQQVAVADQLLAMADNDSQQQFLNVFLGGWSQTAPNEALSWAIANGSRIDPSAFLRLASGLVRRDAQLAADLTPQIPVAARESWIAAVASGYAQQDSQRALDWLSQYQNEPGYDTAMQAIIQSAAMYDPARAAEMLSSASLDDGQAAAAAAQVVAVWARTDPVAARTWVQNMPRGQARDTALTALVGTAADASLLDSTLSFYSSDAARSRAVTNLVRRLAFTDPEHARTVINEHVPDPVQRAELERMLDNLPGAGRMNGVGFFTAPVPAFDVIRTE